MTKQPTKSHTLQHAVITKPTKVRGEVVHANVVPRGLHAWAHLSVNVRHFMKEYSLPVILTVLFLLLVGVAMVVRASQRVSLTKLLATATSVTQDYSSLVSNDKVDAPVRGSVTDDKKTAAPKGSSTSFAINSNGTSVTPAPTPSGGGSTGGGTTTPPPVFGAAIAAFSQGSATLECTKPQQKAQFCSKRYDFSATVRTANGPGTVSYGWRSNLSGASQDGTYSAAGGSSQQTLSKSVSISCLSPGTYTMQFVILSPNQVQSTTISFTHNCVGL